jgi:phage/plasmid primase-like uncharacterized protein
MGHFILRFNGVGEKPAEDVQRIRSLPDATAATIAKHVKVPALVAYDSGNLLSVATALHQRYPDKAIVIAGDDDHGIENNPGREKALAAAEAVAGIVVFPNFSAEQRVRARPRGWGG